MGIIWEFLEVGALFWSPCKEDHRTLGSILGSTVFWNPQIESLLKGCQAVHNEFSPWLMGPEYFPILYGSICLFVSIAMSSWEKSEILRTFLFHPVLKPRFWGVGPVSGLRKTMEMPSFKRRVEQLGVMYRPLRKSPCQRATSGKSLVQSWGTRLAYRFASAGIDVGAFDSYH